MARPKNSPGSLRHLVTIQTATPSSDSRGGYTESWGTQTTAWARISPVAGWERYQQDQVQAGVDHVVTIRYQSGIRAKMRVLWGSRVFQIVGVRTVDEEYRWTILECVEERV